MDPSLRYKYVPNFMQNNSTLYLFKIPHVTLNSLLVAAMEMHAHNIVDLALKIVTKNPLLYATIDYVGSGMEAKLGFYIWTYRSQRPCASISLHDLLDVVQRHPPSAGRWSLVVMQV